MNLTLTLVVIYVIVNYVEAEYEGGEYYFINSWGEKYFWNIKNELGREFKLFGFPKTNWTSARSRCESLDMQLATFSYREFHLFKDNITQPTWIGGKAYVTGLSWIYDDSRSSDYDLDTAYDVNLCGIINQDRSVNMLTCDDEIDRYLCSDPDLGTMIRRQTGLSMTTIICGIMVIAVFLLAAFCFAAKCTINCLKSK